MSGSASIAGSSLLRRIALALEESKPERGQLHVSVARTPTWEKRAPNSEESVLVRWLCWSIADGGRGIVAPEFEVLHPDVTAERLREDLPALFPQLEVIVDNDVEG